MTYPWLNLQHRLEISTGWRRRLMAFGSRVACNRQVVRLAHTADSLADKWNERCGHLVFLCQRGKKSFDGAYRGAPCSEAPHPARDNLRAGVFGLLFDP